MSRHLTNRELVLAPAYAVPATWYVVCCTRCAVCCTWYIYAVPVLHTLYGMLYDVCCILSDGGHVMPLPCTGARPSGKTCRKRESQDRRNELVPPQRRKVRTAFMYPSIYIVHRSLLLVFALGYCYIPGIHTAVFTYLPCKGVTLPLGVRWHLVCTLREGGNVVTVRQ